MFRIFFFIIAIAGISYGLSLIADMDGKLIIQWPGGEIQPTLMQAVIALIVLLFVIMFAWGLFRAVLNSPGNLRKYLFAKRQKKGLDALSGGLIALGAGDKVLAEQQATLARKSLPNDPMTQLLRAQAAELKGDVRTATRIYESMLVSSETEIMGLRGLYRLAIEQKEFEAAKQYASRAAARNPVLPWAVLGVFDIYCRHKQWQDALDMLAIAIDQRHIEQKKGRRLRAVLLTALAGQREDNDEAESALEKAYEAHRLEPSLIPAAVIAGRIYAAMGKMSQAAKVIKRCWKLNPHPDLAIVSAFARPGDSVQDRLQRVRDLAKLTPGHREAAFAVATAAIEAKDWGLAREFLGPLSRGSASRRVCLLMARIEGSEHGDKGAMRAWLARAVHAPKDPCWVAEDYISDEWEATSPRSGKLDAFEWKVPQEDSPMQGDVDQVERILETVGQNEQLEQSDDINALNEIEDDELELDEAETLEDITEDVEEAVIEVEPETKEAVDEVVAARSETKTSDETSIVGEQTAEQKPELQQDAARANKKKKKKKRTKIFVSPPAPDDPGTEDAEDAEFSDKLRPVRF